VRILFGTDGIRGIAGAELSAELAFKVGNAIALIEKERQRHKVAGNPQLFVGKDTRVSCDMLCNALSAGAAAGGLCVYDCGVLPTPALAYITRLHGSAGVMISASHNTYEFNGLKILRDGFKLPDAEEARIEKVVLSDGVDVCTHAGIGRVLDYSQARGEYVRWVLGKYPDGRIGFPGKSAVRVVMDPGNGAAYRIAPEVLRVLGVEVLLVNDEPDGFNINLECGSQHTHTLRRKVLETKADFGIAYDGDADRCIFVDDRGKLTDGDKLMAVTALYYRDKGILTGNQIVATVMSNLGLETFLKENHIGMERTRVGDRYVLEKMLANDRVLGGEQSGHVIFLDRSTTGDGLITSLTVLEAVAHFGLPLSRLTERIPEYPQILRNVKVNDRERVMELAAIKEAIEECKGALGDDGRILLRPSGTEPLIRIMLEGKDMDVICRIAEEIAAKVERADA